MLLLRSFCHFSCNFPQLSLKYLPFGKLRIILNWRDLFMLSNVFSDVSCGDIGKFSHRITFDKIFQDLICFLHFYDYRIFVYLFHGFQDELHRKCFSFSKMQVFQDTDILQLTIYLLNNCSDLCLTWAVQPYSLLLRRTTHLFFLVQFFASCLESLNTFFVCSTAYLQSYVSFADFIA